MSVMIGTQRDYRVWVAAKPKSLQSAGKSTAYKAAIQAAARSKFASPLTLDVEVEVVFADKYGLRPDQRPDVDNVMKPILDALNGIAYVDDKQVKRQSSTVLPMDPLMRKVDGDPFGAPHHT